MPRTRRLLTSCALAAAGILAVGAPLAGRPAPQQPEFATLKADFVPGEKTLFYDDFTQDDLGEFPAHWTLKQGTLEVAEMNGQRWLRSTVLEIECEDPEHDPFCTTEPPIRGLAESLVRVGGGR